LHQTHAVVGTFVKLLLTLEKVLATSTELQQKTIGCALFQLRLFGIQRYDTEVGLSAAGTSTELQKNSSAYLEYSDTTQKSVYQPPLFDPILNAPLIFLVISTLTASEFAMRISRIIANTIP
jgi:hypothetical protein